MKVYISDYRYNWISPYTMIEYVFFWTAWSKCGRSKEIVKDTDWVAAPEWVDTVADKLRWISVSIQWVLDKIRPRITYVKIDKYDTWSMDNTLALLIVPMLKQLKATKHGVPMSFAHHVDPRTGKEITFGKAEREWNKTLDKMIWSFEQLLDDTSEDQFWSGEDDKDLDILEIGKSKRKLDYKALQKHDAKIQEGLDLFSKYYRNLWD